MLKQVDVERAEMSLTFNNMWIGQVSRVELSRFKAEPINSRCTKECHELHRGLILWLRPMLNIDDFHGGTCSTAAALRTVAR